MQEIEDGRQSKLSASVDFPYALGIGEQNSTHAKLLPNTHTFQAIYCTIPSSDRYIIIRLIFYFTYVPALYLYHFSCNLNVFCGPASVINNPAFLMCLSTSYIPIRKLFSIETSVRSPELLKMLKVELVHLQMARGGAALAISERYILDSRYRIPNMRRDIY
jgi:hypothetical protein